MTRPPDLRGAAARRTLPFGFTGSLDRSKHAAETFQVH